MSDIYNPKCGDFNHCLICTERMKCLTMSPYAVQCPIIKLLDDINKTSSDIGQPCDSFREMSSRVQNALRVMHNVVALLSQRTHDLNQEPKQ